MAGGKLKIVIRPSDIFNSGWILRVFNALFYSFYENIDGGAFKYWILVLWNF